MLSLKHYNNHSLSLLLQVVWNRLTADTRNLEHFSNVSYRTRSCCIFGSIFLYLNTRSFYSLPVGIKLSREIKKWQFSFWPALYDHQFMNYWPLRTVGDQDSGGSPSLIMHDLCFYL